MSLTDDDIAQILKLIDATPFDEIDIEWKGLKIQLRRGKAAASPATGRTSAPSPAKAPEPKASIQTPAAEAAPKAEKGAPRVLPLPPGMEGVKAPTMGTFYRCPEPGAPPFVERGGAVAAGDTLCLIEVMKVFNAVTAERAGTVEEICVDDGSLVEFDQTLFHLRPHDA